MIEDDSACVTVALFPPIRPMNLPPFPAGEEFINKKETAPEEESTPQKEDITHTEAEEFAPSSKIHSMTRNMQYTHSQSRILENCVSHQFKIGQLLQGEMVLVRRCLSCISSMK